MQHRLRILHFSDLHERVFLAWMDASRKLKIEDMAPSRYRVLDREDSNLLEVIRDLASSEPIDFVCLTGDAADWGLPEEYPLVTKRIQDILEVANVPLTRFFIVPGNHDVQRKVSADVWESMRTLPNDVYIKQLSMLMGGRDDAFGVQIEWREQILGRTSVFWEWVVRDLGLAHLDPTRSPHRLLGYRACLRADDLPNLSSSGAAFPVNIVGFDSAWIAGDDHDTGKVMLTDRQVNRLVRDDDSKSLPGFRLALMHHALTDLADYRVIRPLLANKVDVILHGHVHEPLVEESGDPDRSLRTIAAGCLYHGDEGDKWVNSFHLIDVSLDEEGHPLKYDLEFWGWSDHGHWFRNGAIYREAKEGRVTWWTRQGVQLAGTGNEEDSEAAPSVSLWRNNMLTKRLGTALSTIPTVTLTDTTHHFTLIEREDLLDYGKGDFFSIRRLTGRNASDAPSDGLIYSESSEQKLTFREAAIKAFDLLTGRELIVEANGDPDELAFTHAFKIHFPGPIAPGEDFDLAFCITLPGELKVLSDQDEVMSLSLVRIGKGVEHVRFSVCLSFRPKSVSVECLDVNGAKSVSVTTPGDPVHYVPSDRMEQLFPIEWSSQPYKIVWECTKPDKMLYMIRYVR